MKPKHLDSWRAEFYTAKANVFLSGLLLSEYYDDYEKIDPKFGSFNLCNDDDRLCNSGYF